MKEIKLINPYPHGSEGDEPEKDGIDFLNNFEEMEKLRKAGKPIYIKINSGDRKGSIAKFVTNVEIKTSCYLDSYKKYWEYRVGTSGHLVWDGRKNKIQYYLTDGWNHKADSFLKNYEGPTIFKLFNKKKAKEELLKNVNVEDIDGNKLQIGDEVIFINIRYGSGADLTRGKIIRFDAKVDSQSHTIFTIVKDIKTNEECKIEKTHRLILKNN